MLKEDVMILIASRQVTGVFSSNSQIMAEATQNAASPALSMAECKTSCASETPFFISVWVLYMTVTS